MVSLSWIYALDYDDLLLSGAELEEVKSLCIFGANLDSKLTFENRVREVV